MFHMDTCSINVKQSFDRPSALDFLATPFLRPPSLPFFTLFLSFPPFLPYFPPFFILFSRYPVLFSPSSQLSLLGDGRKKMEMSEGRENEGNGGWRKGGREFGEGLK